MLLSKVPWSKILIIFMFLGFIGLAASTYSTSSTAEYAGEDESISFYCDSSDSECTGDNIDVTICDSTVENVEGNSFQHPNGEGYTYSISGQIAPEKFECGYGEKEVAINDDEDLINDRITIEEYGDIEPNIADNLIVNINLEDGQLRNFVLTDDQWEETEDSDTSTIMAQKYNPDTFGASDQEAFEVEEGIVGENDVLSDVVSDYDEKCVENDNDVCEVIDQDFTDSFLFEFGDIKGSVWGTDWNIDNFSPIHTDTDYFPDQELAVARQPSHYGDGNELIEETDTKFFVCRESQNTMDNGFDEEVPQVVIIEEAGVEQLYRCDSGEWEETEECDTGLDHDGDGDIDHEDSYYHTADLGSQSPDDQCDTEDGASETWTDDCNAYVDTAEGTDEKVAKYNGEFSNEECNYDTDDSEGYTGEAEVFHCYNETDINDYRQNISEITEDQNIYCNNMPDSSFFEYEDLDYGYHPEWTEQYTEGDKDKEAYKMPVVEYYVDKEHVPLTSENREVASRYVDDEKGWDNRKFQTLKEAMNQYHTSPWVEEGDHPHYNDCTDLFTVVVCPATKHNDHTYSISNFLEYEGYEDLEPEQYINSWIVENSGVVDTDTIVSRGDDLTDDEFFEGGFAGKCDEEEPWQYSYGSWGCSTQSGERSEITATFYNVQGAGETFEEIHTGLEIRESDMQDWVIAHPYTDPAGNEDSEPLKASAQCWVGTVDERPEDVEDETVQIEATVKEDQTTYLIGELPERSGEFTGDQYSCLYGFKQKVTNLTKVPHNNVDLFIDGDPIEVEENEDGEEEYFDSDGNEISEAYITEGSQSAGMIESSTQNVVPTEGYNMDWLEQRSAHHEPDNEDDEQIGNATEIPSNQDPWPHHTRDDGGGQRGSGPLPRHPVDVSQDDEIE